MVDRFVLAVMGPDHLDICMAHIASDLPSVSFPALQHVRRIAISAVELLICCLGNIQPQTLFGAFGRPFFCALVRATRLAQSY